MPFHRLRVGGGEEGPDCAGGGATTVGTWAMPGCEGKPPCAEAPKEALSEEEVAAVGCGVAYAGETVPGWLEGLPTGGDTAEIGPEDMAVAKDGADDVAPVPAWETG